MARNTPWADGCCGPMFIVRRSLPPYPISRVSGIFLFAVGAPSQGSGARRSAIDCVAGHYFIGETDVGTSTAACMVISKGRALARNACQSGSPSAFARAAARSLRSLRSEERRVGKGGGAGGVGVEGG